MADVSKLTIASGTYDIKDAAARSDISNMKNAGIITSYLANGSVTKDKLSSALQTDIYNRSKVFLIIGDSYGAVIDNYYSFVPELANMLQSFYSPASCEVHNLCVGGTAFYDDTFYNQLTGYTGDKSAVTDICIFGGYNETFNTSGNITQKTTDFNTYLRINYPNAKVHIAMIGWNNAQSLAAYNIRMDFVQRIIPAYKRTNRLGWHYLTDSEMIMRYYFMFKDDNIHPTQSAATSLAQQLFNGIVVVS